jgi:hypothetical protein
MRAEIEKINIIGLTREDAKDIRDELRKLTNGNLCIMPEYKKLYALDSLLCGLFNAVTTGVHTIREED